MSPVPHRTALLLAFLALSSVGAAFLFGILEPAWAAGLFALALLANLVLPRFERPRLAPGINLALLAAAGTLILVEVIARATAGDLLAYRPNELLLQRWPPYPLVFRYRENAEIRMQAYGDLAAISGDPEFRQYREEVFFTDAYGFPNPPEAPGPPHSLVLLGDSFTAGTGVSREYAWPGLLRSAHGLAAYNMAIPGSPWNSYTNFAIEIDRLGLAPGSRVLLVLFPANDLDESYGRVRLPGEIDPGNPLWEIAGRIANFRARSVLRALALRAAGGGSGEPFIAVHETSGGELMLFYNLYAERAARSEAEIRAHPNFGSLLEVLRALDAAVRSQEAQLLVVVIPSKEVVYRWLLEGTAPAPPGAEAFTRAIAPELEALGVPLYDMLPDLHAEAVERYAEGELIWWTDDSHFNLLGHRVAAELIADFLRREGGLTAP